jgi:putative ABC transport system permease protein
MTMWRRLRAWVRSSPLDRELDAEMRFHLEMEAQKHIDRGLSTAEARARARRDFGPLVKHREAARDARGLTDMRELTQDIRYAVRTLTKNPGFSLLAVVTLALGIGANTVIFSIVDAAYFSRYPLREPDRLLRIYGEDRAGATAQLGFSLPRFEFFRDHQTTFASVAAANYNGFALENPTGAEQVPGAAVTSAFFETIGATPLIGRFMRPDEEVDSGVVVLGEQMWRTRFAASPSALGQVLTLSGAGYTIIGVAPRLPGFWDAAVFLPDPFVVPGLSRELMLRGVTFLSVLGRLREGATDQQARRELAVLAAQYRSAHAANADAAWDATAVGLRDDIVGTARASLLTLLWAVGLLVVVACANVANLLLVRFAGRRQEIGLRTALGASRGRIVRQFLVESTLLSVVAAAAGAALAHAALPVLLVMAPNTLAFASDIHVSWAVLAATAALAVAVGLAMGMYPSLQSSRSDTVTALRDGGRSVAGAAGAQRVGRAIVAAQVAISLVLVVGAVLLVTSFLHLRQQPVGFAASDAFVAGINLPSSRYPDPASQGRLYDALAAELRQAPGVTHAVMAQTVPLLGPYSRAPYATAEGVVPPLAERPLGLTESVTPGYFDTMQIPLLAGRDFTDRDTAASSLVAIVSVSTARRLFNGETAVIGRRIIMGSQGGGQVMEIVGVSGDVRSVTLASTPEVEFYRPVSQRPRTFMQMVVRTTGDAAAFEPSARRIIGRLDPSLPLTGVTTLERTIDQSLGQERLLFSLLALFAGLAVVLSTVGIYGVVATFVGQRTVEIGLRMALGARATEIVGLVFRQSVPPVLVGLGLGIVAAAGLARSIQVLLYGVSALNPVTLTGAAATLAIIATTASAVPARRAARISPAVALRGE